MKEIQNYVNKLKIGSVQQYENMAVAPLMGKDSKLDYLVFDEAISLGLNVSETGSVQSLRFSNNTDKEVLIIQGEYVLGGKQNRMVSRNVYMAKDFDGEVPVNCVQQHRWSSGMGEGRFRSSSKRAPRELCFAASISQGEVWNEVNYLHANLEVRSETANLEDAYDQKNDELSDYLSNFGYEPGSVGVVAVIQKQGKKVYSADIFDRGDTMEKHFNKLLESYAIEAITGGEKAEQNKKDMTKFLGSLKDCNFNEQKPISLGRDFTIMGNNIQGSALLYNKTNVYVTFSTKPERINTGPGRRSGRERLRPDISMGDEQ